MQKLLGELLLWLWSGRPKNPSFSESSNTTYPPPSFWVAGAACWERIDPPNGHVNNLVARAIRNAIRANRFARIIRN